MFGINLFNSLAMRSPLNGALHFAGEEPVAAHREPQVAVVTEPRLGSPVLVAFRWQTKYPRRSPMRGQHWQRQVAKSPRPVFPAYQVNRRSAVLLPSCSGKATDWRFGPWQSLRCQGELLPGALTSCVWTEFISEQDWSSALAVSGRPDCWKHCRRVSPSSFAIRGGSNPVSNSFGN